MTRINPSQQSKYFPTTGSTGTSAGTKAAPGSNGSGLQSTQLLQKLVEALVTIVQQVEKQVGGGSLHSSGGESGPSALTSAGASGGASQQRALDSAFNGGHGNPLDHLGSGTTGGAVTSSATGGSVTSSAAGGVGGVGAAAPSGPFSETQLHGYISQALAQNPGGDNSLSGPQNLAKWDPNTASGKKNLDSFYNGIVSAQKQFYPQVPIDQFAKMMVAESAQESTLNPDIENGDGVIQANQSVRDDFAKYGQPLKDNQGNVLVAPGSANSKDPASCVMLWAWRTSSALAHGGNGPAQWNQAVKATQSSHLGNALSVWLQGPASQPFFNNGQLDTSSHYVSRIQSFYQKLGGTPADFQKLMGTQVGSSK